MSVFVGGIVLTAAVAGRNLFSLVESPMMRRFARTGKPVAVASATELTPVPTG